MLGQVDGRQSLADGMVRIEVTGRPRTKGSLKPSHVKIGPGRCRVGLTEDGEFSKPWKEHMMRAIIASCRVERFEGAVIVETFFRFERLASEERAGEPWPVKPPGPTAQGDWDKLTRNVGDALTQSGLIKDDCLVIGGPSYKRFVLPGEPAGVLIKVRPAVAADLDAILALERA
jgi:Holliday junction resolvase RusA-like endonuclease